MATHYKGTRAEVRALDVFIKLLRATNSVSSRVSAPFQDEHLTSSQFGVLETLVHLGPMCQKALAEKLLVTGGNVTMVVDNLEKRGLVRRQRDTEDRRYITISLTEAGRKLISTIFPHHVHCVLEAMSVLPARDQEELARLLRTLGKGQAG